MAATLIDERQEEEDVSSVDELGQTETPQPDPEPDPTPDPEDIPEKYQGKSMKELVQMHQEAEKLTGRQGNEVGELRKIVDDFIKSQPVTDTAPKEDPEEEIDWYTDPKGAIDKAVASHPSVQKAEQQAQEYKRTAAMSELQKKHPDMQEIVSSDKFAEWIKASKVRTRLFIEADQGYDLDAADELISSFKERQGVAKATASAEKTARSSSIKAASSGGARGSDAPNQKVYRRSDIIKLMQTDPDRYEALSGEILRAYEEGRVR